MNHQELEYMGHSRTEPPRAATPAPPKPAPRRGHKQITCPHCWNRFPRAEILWVSRHAELRGDRVVGSDKPLRFLPTRFTIDGQAIDGRGMACQELACPQCHLTIPRDLLEIEPLFLSIIGAPSSGKSYFLTSMTWQLRHIMPSRFCITFSDPDPLSNLTLNEYERTLFLGEDPDGMVSIRKTELEGELYNGIQLGEQSVRLPRPFLFTVRPTPRHPNYPNAATINRVLCLYDNAGEHFRPGMDSSAAPVTHHLAKARAIMFLYDPTQDPRFRERCRKFSQDPQLVDKGRLERQETILSEAALRVRRYAGLTTTQRFDRPLLVLVAKSDVWSPLLSGVDVTTEPFVEQPGKINALDLPRIELTSAKLRELLRSVVPDFVAAAEDFCDHVVYIPVSALGGAPVHDPASKAYLVRSSEIQPRWVTVPVLYAFAKWSSGMIPGLKRKSVPSS